MYRHEKYHSSYPTLGNTISLKTVVYIPQNHATSSIFLNGRLQVHNSHILPSLALRPYPLTLVVSGLQSDPEWRLLSSVCCVSFTGLSNTRRCRPVEPRGFVMRCQNQFSSSVGLRCGTVKAPWGAGGLGRAYYLSLCAQGPQYCPFLVFYFFLLLCRWSSAFFGGDSAS